MQQQSVEAVMWLMLAAAARTSALTLPLSAVAAPGAPLYPQGGVLLQLSSLLAAYQERNVTTVYDNHYPVWQVKQHLAGRGGWR